MMGRQVCYLYEYRGRERVRNVGFVRVDVHPGGRGVEVCAKGIETEAGEMAGVYAFFMEARECRTFLVGTVRAEKGSLSRRFELSGFGADDREAELTGKKAGRRAQDFQGIFLEGQSGEIYAALWEDAEVDFTIRKPMREPVERRQEVKQEEPPMRGALEEAEERTDSQEKPEAGLPMGEMVEEEQGGTGKQKEENIVPASAMVEVRTGELVTEALPQEECTEISCRKIQRGEIAMLRRKEWRLANNSFLLHGYYNYHHLLLVEKGGVCKLGVPGIYHRREKQAAESFGFGEFQKAAELPVTLLETERNDYEEFGYWCRSVEKSM